MKYQPEIDGLRAVSVLSVLFYHLGARWIPGGFTGVDIFFVISGFLITGIIRNEVLLGSFSFSAFYARRIRRIFPALIAVLLATSIAGYFVLAPGDYDTQGRSAIAAALSISNIYFFFNTGYFDNAAETLPLLHTWSLGVEEQFYIILPIILVALSRTKLREFTLTALSISVVSILLISAWRVSVDQKSAFYLTQYRAWELGAGALLAYFPSTKVNLPLWCSKILPIVGISLIGFSVFSYHPNGTFPGYGALPSVVGAVLILAFVGRDNLVNRVLSFSPMVSIGKISYSLYLWHWPLIVYWRHYTSGTPISTSEQFMIGAFSILFGWLSWRWIETPLRHAKASQRSTIIIGAAGMILAAAPAAIIAASAGFPSRIPEDYSAMQSKEKMWSWECPDNLSLQGKYACSVGAPWKSGGNKAFIFGDSHAQHMLPLLNEAGLKTNTSIAHVGSCPPIFRPDSNGLRHFDPTYNKQCLDSRNELFKLLSSNEDVKTVILAELWPMLGYTVYKEPSELDDVMYSLNTGDERTRRIAFSRGSSYIAQEIHSLAIELAKTGRRLIVVSDTPTFQHDPIPCFLAKVSTLMRRTCKDDSEHVTRSQMEAYQLPMAEIFRRVSQGQPTVQVVIPTDELCRKELCEAYINDTYIYRDADHIRRNMSRKIYAILSDRIGLTAALASHVSNGLQDNVSDHIDTTTASHQERVNSSK